MNVYITFSFHLLYVGLGGLCCKPAATTNSFRQLLFKVEDRSVQDFRFPKWKVFANRKIKDLYQKAIKSEAVNL